jgi:hypothetical protein
LKSTDPWWGRLLLARAGVIFESSRDAWFHENASGSIRRYRVQMRWWFVRAQTSAARHLHRSRSRCDARRRDRRAVIRRPITKILPIAER